MLTATDGKNLICLSRETITLSFHEKKPDLSRYSKYSKKQGVFVTLNKNNELRGCIGYPTPVYPLYEGVFRASIAAAFDDPRFNQITKDEIELIDIEISVLSLPEILKAKAPQDYLKKIKIGKHGLIIKTPFASGLLLPQVAVERKWNSLEFLENTCLKSGLQKNSWKEENINIYTFQAQIFKEKN